MSTTDETNATGRVLAPARSERRVWRLVLLGVGAFAFVFPFYYMFIGSLQQDADSGIGGALPQPGNLTGANYADIDDAIDLFGSLINSAIITVGVLLGTIFFGLLAGYGRDDGPLVLYALCFAPPYLVLTPWRRLLSAAPGDSGPATAPPA